MPGRSGRAMADTPTFMGDWQETHFSDQTGFSYLDSLPSLTPLLESISLTCGVEECAPKEPVRIVRKRRFL